VRAETIIAAIVITIAGLYFGAVTAMYVLGF
jgi:hypothetical protein